MTMSNEIMVSINCITYNQEQYIEEAINSFLKQKTSFSFEILIHDDASTDRTPEILKKYEETYPDIIKVIYQTENQYRKGKRVISINGKEARGKYMAFCEGDDYWTDPNKLQKQVDFMEAHSEYSLCTHSADVIDVNTKDIIRTVRPSKENRDFNTKEIILKDGSLFPTNSILCKTSLFKELPLFYHNAPVGDYPMVIYFSLKGKVYYMDEIMSIYRVGVIGSWSTNMKKNVQYYVEQKKRIIKMLQEINEYTNYNYNATINKRIYLVQKDKIKQIAFNLPMKEVIKHFFDCSELNLVRKIKYWCVMFLAKPYYVVRYKNKNIK